MLSKSLLSLGMREALSRQTFDRQPGVSAVEKDITELRATEEAAARAFQGVYHFCAVATSQLLPANGLVLDLGCGSGAFAIELAKHRPDITIIGVERTPLLVELGHQFVAEAGLHERININEGEIGKFSQRISFQVDMITSVFGMHTATTQDDLYGCLKDMSLVRIRHGCAIFLFDFVRPHQVKTASELPEALIPGAPISVRRSCRNALVEAFTFEEMSAAMGAVSLGTVNHAQSTGVRVYQTHWLDREDGLRGNESLWRETLLSGSAQTQYKEVAALLPKFRLDKKSG